MKKEAQTVEAKHIFIDIVSYTYNRSVEAQSDLISTLNRIVKESIKENEIDDEKVLFIPTGDGMCISLLNVFSPYDIHIEISLDILEKINLHNQEEKDKMRQFHLRIGVNENIDNLIVDINGQKNISGSGINYAARIESMCDQNQILVGNAVFEKLAQREKYIESFVSYSAEAKHGLPLKVHQYRDEKLIFLNNEPPSKFKPAPKKSILLTPFQAYYIAHCIVHEDFSIKNMGLGQEQSSLQVLLYQLAEDSLAKSKTTKTKPNYNQKVKRELQEHYEYIQSVDFWLIYDLCNNLMRDFHNISNCFSENFLYINDTGKKKLLEDQPKIYEEIDIK